MAYESRQHDDCWDDLRSPATGINPPGAASDPVFEFDHHAVWNANGSAAEFPG